MPRKSDYGNFNQHLLSLSRNCNLHYRKLGLFLRTWSCSNIYKVEALMQYLPSIHCHSSSTGVTPIFASLNKAMVTLMILTGQCTEFPVPSAESISFFNNKSYFNACHHGGRHGRSLIVAGIKTPPRYSFKEQYSCLQNGIALLTAPPESTGAASILFPVSDRQHPQSKDPGQQITAAIIVVANPKVGPTILQWHGF